MKLFIYPLFVCFAILSFAKKRPNILWIVGENLKLDLGCYGAKNVKTPNLDKLASEGEIYKSLFNPPVYDPVECFFVGMYQTTSDTHNMRSHRRMIIVCPRCTPDYASIEGYRYYTANLKP